MVDTQGRACSSDVASAEADNEQAIPHIHNQILPVRPLFRSLEGSNLETVRMHTHSFSKTQTLFELYTRCPTQETIVQTTILLGYRRQYPQGMTEATRDRNRKQPDPRHHRERWERFKRPGVQPHWHPRNALPSSTSTTACRQSDAAQRNAMREI